MMQMKTKLMDGFSNYNNLGNKSRRIIDVDQYGVRVHVKLTRRKQ
jgi:hypothetical protein